MMQVQEVRKGMNKPHNQVDTEIKNIRNITKISKCNEYPFYFLKTDMNILLKDIKINIIF